MTRETVRARREKIARATWPNYERRVRVRRRTVLSLAVIAGGYLSLSIIAGGTDAGGIALLYLSAGVGLIGWELTD